MQVGKPTPGGSEVAAQPHRQQEACKGLCMPPFPAPCLVASQLGTYSEGTHDLQNGLGSAECWACGNRRSQGPCLWWGQGSGPLLGILRAVVAGGGWRWRNREHLPTLLSHRGPNRPLGDSRCCWQWHGAPWPLVQACLWSYVVHTLCNRKRPQLHLVPVTVPIPTFSVTFPLVLLVAPEQL